MEDAARVHLRTLELPLMEISSSDLRMRAARRKSLLFMVPHAVEVYIREKKLYRE
jgi:nicotinate-nucleotide adenylyltransferase